MENSKTFAIGGEWVYHSTTTVIRTTYLIDSTLNITVIWTQKLAILCRSADVVVVHFFSQFLVQFSA